MQCPIICLHKQGCQNLMKLGTYIVYMAFLQEMEFFFFFFFSFFFLIWASTSGVRAPPGAEASFYSLQGKLLCNFAHFYLPFISKVHFL